MSPMEDDEHPGQSTLEEKTKFMTKFEERAGEIIRHNRRRRAATVGYNGGDLTSPRYVESSSSRDFYNA